MSVSARKIATILRCVERARYEYVQAGASFRQDQTRQDAAVLNVIRASEAAIDLANMVIRKKILGVPSEPRESFALLDRNNLIPRSLAESLQRMIGFRNIAVHQYQDLDMHIVGQSSVTADDLLTLAQTVRGHLETA